jgi:hypothetical protein
MKSFFFLFLTCCCIAQVPRPQEYPPSYFESKEVAIKSTETAFAGGSFQELAVGTQKVLVLYHYASGAFSSDAAIYREEKSRWILVAYFAPKINEGIQAQVQGSNIVLLAEHKKVELLSVLIEP